jgi:Tfp pilus assembly protein FimT
MTLIELILVMTILTTLMAIAMPALSGFFRGRRLREEGRRLLALTRYAREEAVSRATPMELWLDPEEESYGLRPRLDTGNGGPASLEFQAAEGLELDLDRKMLDERGVAVIHFLPDGTIDEGSLDAIGIRSDKEGEIMIERSDVGVGYSIQ